MAIEEASYNVIKKDKMFEVREYAPHILAETLVDGELKDVGRRAFQKLFGYISGENVSRTKVAMTAPVVQQRIQDQWAVSFMMPKASTLSTLPKPLDDRVTLRQVPDCL